LGNNIVTFREEIKKLLILQLQDGLRALWEWDGVIYWYLVLYAKVTQQCNEFATLLCFT